MAVPDYGAAPLAKFFLMVRILSLIAMVCIVGITANFVSEIVSSNIEPPREVIATLAIVSSDLTSRTTPSKPKLTLTQTDLHRSLLLPDQHPHLLRPRQPRPPHHDRPGLWPSPLLHRHRRLRRPTPQLPQLQRRRLLVLSSRCPVRCHVRAVSAGEHQRQRCAARPRELGG